MTHSEDYWNGRLDETKFGGGATDTLYAETEPANTAALVNLQSQPFNETQVFPVLEYAQTAFESAGQAVSTKQTFTVDTMILEGEKHQFVQNDDWIIKAIAGTADSVPTGSSWCEVYYDGQRYKQAFGCYITEYTLTIPTPSATDAPKEDILYDTWKVKDVGTPGNFATAAAWVATAANEHFDYSISIDAVALNDWSDASLTVTPVYSEKKAGAEYHKFPKIEKLGWELSVTTYDYVAVLEDLETSAANLFSVVIVGWETAGASPATLTLTNMKIQPESIDIKDVPEKGLKEYTFTIEIGGASTAVLT